MKFLAPIVAIVASFSISSAEKIDYTGHKLYRFDVASDSDLTQLQSYVSSNKIDNWNDLRVGKVDLHLTPQQSVNVKGQIKLKYEVLSENIQKLFDAEQVVSKVAGFVDSYHSIAEINTWLDQIAAASNGAAKVFTIGSTYEGRQIKGISFRKPGSSPKKSVVYHGGIHAREWISPATLISLIDNFSRFSSDAAISSLLDTFEYNFIPVINVDGYEFTRSGDRLWRKNRQPNAGSSCVGTDTNRNWGFQWQGSADKCSEAYPGPSPFSSPEAKAISNFISSKANVVHYIDFHSYGQMFMSPYGYTCNANPADFAAQDSAAKQANSALAGVNGRKYKQGTICKTIYQAFGSSVDWAYATAKVKYPYAIELPDTGSYGFSLPASFIPSVGKEILAAVKSLGDYIKKAEGL